MATNVDIESLVLWEMPGFSKVPFSLKKYKFAVQNSQKMVLFGAIY